MRTPILPAVLFSALLGGCLAMGDVEYSGEVDTPELVEVSPGVQVVSDFDQPVFYSDNMYWRFEGGIWYRSRYHTRGWERFDNPPLAIRHIDRPAGYVHYHARAGQHVTPARDHRKAAPAPEHHEAARHEPEHREPAHREPAHHEPDHREPDHHEAVHHEPEHHEPEHREAEHRDPVPDHNSRESGATVPDHKEPATKDKDKHH